MARETDSRDQKISIAIIGDGYVERYYFEDMKDSEEGKDQWFQILPRLPEENGSFDKAINAAIGLVKEGMDIAFAIVDMDVVFSNGKIEEFRRKCEEVNRVNKDYAGKIHLCYCNPCFEYWLLLHFKYTLGPFGACENVFDELTDEIDGYEKTQKFLSNAALYKMLFPDLKMAIRNSERSEQAYDKQHQDDHVISTLHKLFHVLRIGVDYN